ncbi:MSMEG_1061 family FMN-dependent PPOX-type flavoprotein [Kitasatospora sp. SUK 42]|uniref:MSMEG_1061 family FMN-dependent PPOX-type flavoprotein n=1 Tax=Kitasatospora sp. SUK 42 TaxID=1588882 RepID=UPI0018CAC464|nr:MSMEG_1061 family FMN-dependent PPOX-type flavoprotein [Kitasatospora sp. SUK 42]MBV2155217.1 pyridoxamine 5'-phosphate oxidase family protein [Kitasatospora sp. SUK 42]
MTITPEAAVSSTTAPDTPNRLFAALGAGAITDPARLREIYEQPSEQARRKQVDRLHEVAQRLIACSPLVFVASSDASGRCDVSPRGGPAGLVSVLDEYTLAIPDATGNKRLDTLHNIIETGRVGLLFVVPGRDTTLRVNGRACVSTDPELLRQLTAVGKPPRSAIVVAVEEVYGHCPKAFLRASAWKPENWLAKDAQPSSAEVTLSHLRDDALTIELIEQTEREALLYRYE